MSAKAPTIGVVSLGCPKALVDSERIITRLRSEGYQLSGSYEGADLVVVNTCGFLDSAKAESLAAEQDGAVIVGSDQVVEIDGTILGKPGSKEKAHEQLARLAGREHRIVTAVAVRTPSGEVLEHVDVHVMTMRNLTPRAIEAYVDADDPHDCAGAYKLEERGILLFSSIRGDDHTAIVGLPLMATVTLLERAGIPVLEPA